MDGHDALAHLNRQLDELQVLARLLDADTTALSTARLQLLLAAVRELREQEPGRVPHQRTPDGR